MERIDTNKYLLIINDVQGAVLNTLINASLACRSCSELILTACNHGKSTAVGVLKTQVLILSVTNLMEVLNQQLPLRQKESQFG